LREQAKLFYFKMTVITLRFVSELVPSPSMPGLVLIGFIGNGKHKVAHTVARAPYSLPGSSDSGLVQGYLPRHACGVFADSPEITQLFGKPWRRNVDWRRGNW
jgi:hypothetical protein